MKKVTTKIKKYLYNYFYGYFNNISIKTNINIIVSLEDAIYYNEPYQLFDIITGKNTITFLFIKMLQIIRRKSFESRIHTRNIEKFILHNIESEFRIFL